MPKHIHADLMMKAAKIAQTDSEWWKHFQAKNDDKIGWRNLGGEIAFIEGTGFEYRLKPRTVKIGSVDVPEPVREPLEEGQVYYYPDIEEEEKDGLFWDNYWSGSSCDYVRLERGLIHLDVGSAVIHAKALISLTAK